LALISTNIYNRERHDDLELVKIASKFCRRFVEKKLLKPKQILTNNLLSRGEKTKAAKPKQIDTNNRLPFKGEKTKAAKPEQILFLGSVI